VAEPANVDQTNNQFFLTQIGYYKIKKTESEPQINGTEYDY
jgi:hypothetical protein